MSDLTAWIILGAFAVFVAVPAVGTIFKGRVGYIDSFVSGLEFIFILVVSLFILGLVALAANEVLV